MAGVIQGSNQLPEVAEDVPGENGAQVLFASRSICGANSLPAAIEYC
jgi:hypothetical protein